MTRRFPPRILAAIDESKILGIRAGARSDHRFIGIWSVVVGDRLFARSWTLKPGGWYRTLLEDPFARSRWAGGSLVLVPGVLGGLVELWHTGVWANVSSSRASSA